MGNIEKLKIDWHPGFYGGIEYVLRSYKDSLSFDKEHVLSKEPVRMDMMIIKKEPGVKIDNPLGRIFRTYNVIEYKSPEDELSIDDVYKTISYAGLYKFNASKVNAVPAEEM